MTKTVAVLVGSLREGSINRKLAKILETLAEGKLTFDYTDLGALPLYNEDLWADPPKAVLDLKATVAAADGILILAPEYNRTFPGVLANAFDWASRPYGKSAWTGKPAAFGGATLGSTGTAGAQQHVRLAVSNLRMIAMLAPELYIAWSPERFAEDGTVKSDDTRKVLQSFVDSFADWIEQIG